MFENQDSLIVLKSFSNQVVFKISSSWHREDLIDDIYLQ